MHERLHGSNARDIVARQTHAVLRAEARHPSRRDIARIGRDEGEPHNYSCVGRKGAAYDRQQMLSPAYRHVNPCARVAPRREIEARHSERLIIHSRSGTTTDRVIAGKPLRVIGKADRAPRRIR